MMIACHPKKTIAVAVVVSCLLGIGMIRLETERDFAGKCDFSPRINLESPGITFP